MLTDEKQQQIELYGQLLTGDETELDLAKLARIQYLKTKMRPRLAAQIGDYGDNITDVTRAFHLVNGYYSARQQIMAVTEDDEDPITAINSVDLE